MIVGIDFDNTLACYDGLFHAEAVARGLIPPATPTHKLAVRDRLRAQGMEDAWTELQGHVYGPGLAAARPYPGAHECIAALVRADVRIHIVSHKTPYPYLGPRHDLHEAARAWLRQQGFHTPGMLDPADVHLEPTKNGKLARIATLGCTHFVDDLPEFLADPLFPEGSRRILFTPEQEARPGNDADAPIPFRSWTDIMAHLLGFVGQRQ